MAGTCAGFVVHVLDAAVGGPVVHVCNWLSAYNLQLVSWCREADGACSSVSHGALMLGHPANCTRYCCVLGGLGSSKLTHVALVGGWEVFLSVLRSSSTLRCRVLCHSGHREFRVLRELRSPRILWDGASLALVAVSLLGLGIIFQQLCQLFLALSQLIHLSALHWSRLELVESWGANVSWRRDDVCWIFQQLSPKF